jgi:hypothetical protein
VAEAPVSSWQQAEAYLQEAKTRHDNVTTHPDLNGYFRMIDVPAAQYGTSRLFDLYRSQGREALFQAIDAGAGAKLDPFIAQMRKLEGMAEAQYLAVPVQVPPSGPLSMADETRFLDVLKGLAMAPVLDERQTTLEPDYEPSADYSVLAIKIGRKVAYQASTLKHHELGLVMQEEGMAVAERLLKKKALGPEKLRFLISGLQSVEGNTRDFVRIADAEFLAAVRRFQSLKLEKARLSKELNGLAARHLRWRPHFEKNGQAPSDLAALPPEAAECQLVGQEPNLVAAHNRWRSVGTRLSALELKAALELYFADHGTYPDSLEALLRKYLTRLPPDHFSSDGKFHYRREGDSYLLQTLSPDVSGAQRGVRRW